VATLPLTFEAARLRALEPECWPALRMALMGLTIVPEPHCPTAAVDEWWRVYYNPEWFATIPPLSGAAVVVHEVWHLLRFHGIRSRTVGVRPETAFIWNLAADAEIHENNTKLLEALQALGENSQPITRESFDPPLHKGGIAETWYHELCARPSTQRLGLPGSGHGGGVLVPRMAGGTYPSVTVVLKVVPGSGSGHASGENGLPASWEKSGPLEGGPAGITKERGVVLQRQVAEAIRQHSKSRGLVEGGMLRWAEEVLDPKVDWRTALQLHFQGIMAPVCGSMSWTYRRPARRQVGDPRIVMPGWVDPVPRVAVLIDTSGSMSDQMLGHCRGEVTNLISTLVKNGGRPHVKVYACDAAAHEAQQVWTGSEIKLVGGGGTDLTVGFRLVEEDMRHLRHDYDILVVMTDGYCVSPETRVLTSDLRWLRADQIRAGDELLGVDEECCPGRQGRRLSLGAVEDVVSMTSPMIRVVTDRGAINVSANHPFLATVLSGSIYTWRMAAELKPGVRIAYLADPWERDSSWDAGWLAGLYDGEGYIVCGRGKHGTSRLGLAQNAGFVMTRAARLLQERGVRFAYDQNRRTHELRVHGMNSILPLLGRLGSVRLIENFRGQVAHGWWPIHGQHRAATVIAVEVLSPGTVIGIQTSNKTLVTNGFVSHNTPWPQEPFRIPTLTVLMSNGQTVPWLEVNPHRLVRIETPT
jgi:predicted metal-dependent peptidase